MLLFPLGGSVLALLAIGLNWIRFRAVDEGVFFGGGASAENLEGEFSAADSQRHGQTETEDNRIVKSAMNVESEERGSLCELEN